MTFAAIITKAQVNSNFKIGAHVGLPLGDTKDAITVTTGVDVAYVWEVAPNFELGITTGYSAYFYKEAQRINFMDYRYDFRPEPTSLVPVALTTQYNIAKKVSLGLDLGYGFVLNGNREGGFLYQPKLGVIIGKANELYVGYKGISVKGGSVQSFNIGYAYSFRK